MERTLYQQLLQAIKQTKRAAVAFSGGVDSSFLVYAVKEALDGNMLAISVKTPYVADWEIDEARLFADTYGIAHVIVDLALPATITQNPPDRCYLCKKAIFQAIFSRARQIGITTVMEGSNKDDLADYRPGMRALKELGVRSPLLEMGIDKKTIRTLSRTLGLPSWDKPAYACLLSRLPYHTEVTAEELQKIAKAEKVLRQLNFLGSRVRSHGDIARIEVPITRFEEILKTGLRTQLIDKIKACGYLYVTLDLEGYQMGSLNKTLATDQNHEQINHSTNPRGDRKR